MKKSIKFYSVALAALMALGSLTFASCEKESINPQNEIATGVNNTKGLQFSIDEWFHDSLGHCLHIKGYGQWIINNGERNGVYLDIKFLIGERAYYFKGSAVWDITSDPAQVTITPDGSHLMSSMMATIVREFSWHLLFG